MTALLVLAPLLPLILLPGLFLSRYRAWWLALVPWAPFPALLLVLSGPDSALDMPWLLLGVHLKLDTTGQVFLLFTALLWWVAGLYARRYFTDLLEQRRFFAFFLPAMAGNLGLVLSEDLFSFLSFYTLMSLASYGLVIHNRDEEARRAGMVYIVLVMVGEVLLYAGLLLYPASGEQQSVLTALLFIGFGIKAGALPLHVWLPLAHPAAPTPASAVLSGAMIKAGLLGWLRFLPMGESFQPDWGSVVMGLGMAAALGGAVIGLTQRNPKVLLAYSSISQMGLMTVIVGFGLMVPSAWETALVVVSFYALHHALAKGGLFLGVGLADRVVKKKAGYGVLSGISVCALAMAGLPLTSGAVAKLEMKELLLLWPDGFITGLFPLLAVSTIATTLLMLRLLWMVKQGIGRHADHDPLPWLPWLLLLMCVLLAGEIGRRMMNVELAALVAWSAGWPIIAGGGLAYLLLRKPLPLTVQLPVGDLLMVYTEVLRWIQWVWGSGVTVTLKVYGWLVSFSQRLMEWKERGFTEISTIDGTFRRWGVGGALMTVVLVCLVMLMVLGGS